MEKIVITRHQGLLDFLREEGLLSGAEQVQAHASEEDVRGKHVIGVLPLHLAALAGQVTIVEMGRLPASERGRELSAEETRRWHTGIRTFRVTEV